MASTDALPVPRKNVAFRCVFPILDADGDLVTGAAALDSEVSKDQGAFADCTNEATEIATASGVYYLDLTSTEMNADCVAIIVKTSTSGAKTTVLVFYPEEAGDYRASIVSGGIAASAFAADAIDSSALAANAASEIGTAVWATAARTLTANTNLNDLNAAGVRAAVGLATANLDTQLAAIDDFIDTEVATIVTQTSATSIRAAVGLASANLDTQLTAIDDFLDTEVAAIKAKTDNLPTDPADASDIASAFTTVNTKLDTIDDFLDTEVAAIKAKTDSLTFTVANVLDANVQRINDVTITGDGQVGTEFGV